MNELSGARIQVVGVVQGVGFRPFVYGLAMRLDLKGWVRNTSAGVQIAVEGEVGAVASFTRALQDEAPPLARIEQVVAEPAAANGFTEFEIHSSQSIPGSFLPISPDVSICPDCLREMFDPGDRRYRYPFINCTNCGPRFTIIGDIPYDRPKTTMAGFEMCSECAGEYQDPLDRRFHAQPVACPACGPKVWIEGELEGSRVGADGMHGDSIRKGLEGDMAIAAARKMLRDGQIVAIKGLGGFHLACDAGNLAAVKELRRRKLRAEKPFAVMMANVETVARHCAVGTAEAALLACRERPIVILERKAEATVRPEVAPGQQSLGVMLPYTPLHHLLLEAAPGFPEALVMTSGNLSEEPIAWSNQEARERLGELADALLCHDRGIQVRCDDSVVRVSPSSSHDEDPEVPIQLRRSRGYAPLPIRLPWETVPLLATGAELKNTFCLTKGRLAFVSHHIGDMENYETLKAYEQGVAHYERLFRVEPEAIVYDLHPNYLATRYGLERSRQHGLTALGVQHHHAHIASCMAELGHPGQEPVIGVVFDGTGYGEDGTIWGGEFLIADYSQYRRVAHLEQVRLPGGDKAIREPWRMALAWLDQAGIDWQEDLPPVSFQSSATPLEAVRHQLQTGLNAPFTSSAGRLFDAVASLIGLRQKISYEAQGAIELEHIVDSDERGSYSLYLGESEVAAAPLLREVVTDLQDGVQKGVIAARFHNGMAQMVLEVCRRLRRSEGVAEVVLSGGVWQNMVLFKKTLSLLRGDGFEVLFQRQVPSNDGGLSLGQAAIGCRRLLG